MDSLYIWDINSLSDTWFANISSYSKCCPFTVDNLLCWVEILIQCSPTCLVLLLLSWLLESDPKNYGLMSRNLPLLFSSWSSMVSGLTFKSLIHFEFIFCMWLSSFPNTFIWRDYPFPIVYSWLLCCKLIDHIVGLFLGCPFCPLIHELFLMPISYCFDYCCFGI